MGDPISFLKEGSKIRKADVFSLVNSDRTEGKRLKLPQRKYRLNIRNGIFTQRVAGH